MSNEHVKLMCIIYMFIIVYLTMLKLIYRLCALSSQYLAFCPVYAFFLQTDLEVLCFRVLFSFMIKYQQTIISTMSLLPCHDVHHVVHRKYFRFPLSVSIFRVFTPLNANMEPENQPMEKEIPSGGSMLNLGGVFLQAPHISAALSSHL